ncbi:FIG01130091: hypothetical protein [Streptomyces venezuelae]|nr:FIG01130091: hypothetical protein [Streptomyces venezuelae]
MPLHKPPCLQQSCPVPHKYHRRTTRNPSTPGIPQPVRSLSVLSTCPQRDKSNTPHINSPPPYRSSMPPVISTHDEGPDPYGSGPSF